MRRRLLVAAGVVVIVALGLAAAYVLRVRDQQQDVRGSSTVEFLPEIVIPERPKEPGVAWPMWGYNAERVRVAPNVSLAPPFRRTWTFPARTLVEFPPAIAYGRLFFANNAGVVYAINTKTGKRAWRYRSGRCQAMSPAVDHRTVYATFLNKPPCNATGRNLDGELVALWAGSGKVRWRKKIGPSESSPLVRDGNVYVGDWNGGVHSFSARTGRKWWTFQAGGQVKGGLAASGDRLFFGAYDSRVYALNALTGKLIWKAKAQPRLGDTGRFYSTPAVAYGRVYIGATDGKVYSFGAASGQLRWSRSTGGYVYSSPAVWRQSVYTGSYSGKLFRLDAATGEVRWEFKANGKISGSPTIVTGRVYFATLEERTYGLDALTGKQVWTFPDGKYTPVVADDDRLYLTGHARIYGLQQSRTVRSKSALRGNGGGRVHRLPSR
jgi:outer membrane protein assembly factor BamB